MTLTQYGYCPTHGRVELVPLWAGDGIGNVLGCHKCERVDVYEDEADFERAMKEQKGWQEEADADDD